MLRVKRAKGVSVSDEPLLATFLIPSSACEAPNRTDPRMIFSRWADVVAQTTRTSDSRSWRLFETFLDLD